MDVFNDQKFTDRVNDLLTEWHCPGIAIAIVQNNEISSRGFGRASVDPERPVTADTLFDIASCSKSLTAGTVALLVEDDAYPDVTWDAKMSALLPEDFVMSEESYTKDVTVEDILSHRTGIAGHDFSYMHSDTPRTVTRNLRNLQITKAIRTEEQYCNMMYTVATHLFESLTKQTFTDFLRQRFWQPLGMSSTHLGPDAVIAAGLEDRLFTPHRWDKHEQRYHTVKLQQIPEAQGAGSVFTSANDYIRWVKAILNQEGPVSKSVYNGLVKPRIITNADDGPDELEPFSSPSLYAAGLGVVYYRGHKLVSHGGGDPGIGSFHFFLPGLKFGGVLLGNSRTGGDVAYVLARELIDHVLDVPKSDRPDWDQRMHDEDDDYEGKKDDRCKKMLEVSPDADLHQVEPLDRSLESYTGTYRNAGYHDMVVEIKNGQLFIDAADRTMGFYLTLEHFKEQDRFIGHVEDFYDGHHRKMAIRFRFDGDQVASMGVDLEESLEDFIWFNAV